MSAKERPEETPPPEMRSATPPEPRPASRLPAASATPRDVAYVLIGAFVVFFAVCFGALGLLAGIPLLTVAMAVAAVGTVIAIIRAVRTSGRGSDEAG
ncbi:hypothetical protein [Streptosporangium sp. KLBMP 9127]|nr:hypothetical protein [Streptosporangium sp. KLBMP 9127]